MLKSLACSWLLAIASIPCIAQATRPAEISTGEGRAVQAVVAAQLKALAAGDSAAAFSYAAPSIRQQFGDAETFMEMVRRSYPMLIRPESVSFFRPEAGDGGVTQDVHFRDREGKLWRARYVLQKEPDKRWRIGGCVVAADDDASTT